MSTAEFSQFAQAVQATRADTPLNQPRHYQRIAVLGGGIEGQLLAALWLAAGAEVVLFSAYGKELSALRQKGTLSLRGEGPVGNYHVDQLVSGSDSNPQNPAIRLTGELDTALAQAECVIITGPVHKQRTYAMVLADHLSDGQVVVLPEARTFGMVECAWMLRVGGCRADVTLVDIPGLPFWVSGDAGALTLSKRTQVRAATLPANRIQDVQGLAPVFDNLDPAHSCLFSAFSDGSACTDVPALLLGGTAVQAGGPTVPPGAMPLAENDTFRHLLGSQHLDIIAALWEERRDTARLFGVRDLPEFDTLLDRYAGAHKGEGARSVPSVEQSQAALRCAVIGSLSPLVSASELAGSSTPVTRSMIQLASTLLDSDLQSAGRRLDTIGVSAASIDEARRLFDNIMACASAGGTDG